MSAGPNHQGPYKDGPLGGSLIHEVCVLAWHGGTVLCNVELGVLPGFISF